MKRLLIATILVLIPGCAVFDTPVKPLPQDTSCVYIANLGEMLSTYAVWTREADYGGNISYQGAGIGGTLSQQREIISFQDRLNQQAATINAIAKSIVIMHNKSCEQYNTERAWDAMNTLINGLEKVYGPVFTKYGAKE